MDEIIIDGKNIIRPIDLEKYKNEIMSTREKVISKVELEYFKERGFLGLKSNVTGEDANKLIDDIQNICMQIQQRDNFLFNNIYVIYNALEAIRKENIDGIIIAIEKHSDAIKQLKENYDLVMQACNISVKNEERINSIICRIKRLEKINEESQNKIHELDSMQKNLVKDNNDLKRKIKAAICQENRVENLSKELNKLKTKIDLSKRFFVFSIIIEIATMIVVLCYFIWIK